MERQHIYSYNGRINTHCTPLTEAQRAVYLRWVSVRMGTRQKENDNEEAQTENNV